MAIVVFNYKSWLARYPEFATVDPTAVEECFPEACLYCNNTNFSPVKDINARRILLNMLTAHIVFLNFGANGQAPSQLVGRIASAGEGSVNVSTELKLPGSAAWFTQTKYGAAFWQASAAYRMMRYVPPACALPTFPGED
jgi:hypothetical protein